jgi:hypothetical protein
MAEFHLPTRSLQQSGSMRQLFCAACGVSLTGRALVNGATVMLTTGDDSGTTSVTARVPLKTRAG